MRRLIICCDGSWHRLASPYPTNVVKLAQAIKRRDGKGIPQVVHYSEGVGAGKKSRVHGIIGLGLDEDIIEARETRKLVDSLMGKIAAGVPISAIEHQTRMISLPADMIGKGEHYALEVEGDSMIEAGILPEEELATYGMDDSRMPMSGMASYTPGMEITGGSLGHGLGIAVGAALGLKRKRSDRVVYNLMSDGELGEGSTWEAVKSLGTAPRRAGCRRRWRSARTGAGTTWISTARAG